ncbi:hypothetical protein D9756_008912 [Leucocoprinus leucothites]|uniref:F-box domain-containing protein n=1 Tax=Leucocoprinus leucothites TaxID=201217 RepID=A0A8H5CWV7_9AGAR|nr:hypothetical protein D9756_008912 [Leucoagaricus leucothites]
MYVLTGGKLVSRSQDEIAFLNATIRRLDYDIRQLQMIRARHVRRLNELSATTACLPREVLTTIFEHALDRNPNNLHGCLLPLTLGAVCSDWRNIVWATPSLWTCLTVSKTHCHPDMIQLYFQNAQNIPLSLSWHKIYTKEPYDDLQRILRHKPESLSALHCSLVWEFMDDTWSRIYDILSIGLPNLRILEFGEEQSRDEDTKDGILPLPSLVRLVWHGPELPWTFPLENITTLYLTWVYSDLGLRALLECPKLEEFHNILPVERDPSDTRVAQFFHRGDILLPHMSSITWTYDNTLGTKFLLKHVKVPSLKKLHFEGVGPVPFAEEANIAFLRQHFLASLPHLVEYECDVDILLLPTTGESPRGVESAIRSSEPHLPNTIQKLQVNIPRPDDIEYPVTVLRQIFDNLKLTRENPKASFVLPMLKELVVGPIGQWSWLGMSSWNPSITLGNAYPAFLEMVESRREGSSAKWPGACTQLQNLLFDKVGDDWSVNSGPEEDADEFQMGLRKLIRGGLRVEVRTDDDRVMSWEGE